MATYENAAKHLLNNGDAGVQIYECPAGKSAMVKTCQVANVDGSNSADVSIFWKDNSDGDAIYYLAKTIPVPPNTALPVLGDALVLEAGDTLWGVASADGDLDATISIREDDV